MKKSGKGSLRKTHVASALQGCAQKDPPVAIIRSAPDLHPASSGQPCRRQAPQGMRLADVPGPDSRGQKCGPSAGAVSTAMPPLFATVRHPLLSRMRPVAQAARSDIMASPAPVSQAM